MDTEILQLIADQQSLIEEQRTIIDQQGRTLRLHTGMITNLEMSNFDSPQIMDRLTALERDNPIKLKTAIFPAELTRLECQIFHTTAPIEEKYIGKRTEWSLRFTAWVSGRRCTPDINVPLFDANDFSKQVRGCDNPTPDLLELVSMITSHTAMLAGMLRRTTKGKGRPFVPTQFCFIRDFNTDHPKVAVVFDNRHVVFTNFRPARGEQKGRAKYYAAYSAE